MKQTLLFEWKALTLISLVIVLALEHHFPVLRSEPGGFILGLIVGTAVITAAQIAFNGTAAAHKRILRQRQAYPDAMAKLGGALGRIYVELGITDPNKPLTGRQLLSMTDEAVGTIHTLRGQPGR